MTEKLIISKPCSDEEIEHALKGGQSQIKPYKLVPDHS